MPRQAVYPWSLPLLKRLPAPRPVRSDGVEVLTLPSGAESPAAVPCEVHEAPGAFHGFDALAPKTSVAQAYFDSKCAALRAAMAGVNQ